MITPENLTAVLNSLSSEDIDNAFDQTSDYIYLKLHLSNSGCYSDISCMDYDEATEKDANNNGNLFCDKDTFLQLFKDSDSINPFLMELI